MNEIDKYFLVDNANSIIEKKYIVECFDWKYFQQLQK